MDYSLNRRIGIRGDFSAQFWHGWPPHGLTPMLGTVSAFWRF
jgi:hypothetical protein